MTYKNMKTHAFTILAFFCISDNLYVSEINIISSCCKFRNAELLKPSLIIINHRSNEQDSKA